MFAGKTISIVDSYGLLSAIGADQTEYVIARIALAAGPSSSGVADV